MNPLLRRKRNYAGRFKSIEKQKSILLQYAREQHFTNPVFYVDDGYSGTNFDRPGFQQMLAEMEAGHVKVCITKDLSRLGRNSSLYIREKVLQLLVLQHIQMVTGYIYRHEAHFRQVMEQQLHAESAKQIAANRKALERSEKRISELKRLFIRIYEANASGKRRQHIHIQYDGLGFIPLNELLTSEKA